MKEMYSQQKDIELIAYELKKMLGEKISINKFSLGQEVLTGKIIFNENKNARFQGIDFNIKYSKDEFLRINIGEIYLINSLKEKEEALRILSNAISRIRFGIQFGNPIAYYQIEQNGFYIPFCDWVWKNKEEYLEELKNNTLYEDARIENLVLFEEPEMSLCKRK